MKREDTLEEMILRYSRSAYVEACHYQSPHPRGRVPFTETVQTLVPMILPIYERARKAEGRVVELEGAIREAIELLPTHTLTAEMKLAAVVGDLSVPDKSEGEGG